MKNNTIEVRVGQVWEDCDKRNPGRLVKVLRIFTKSYRQGFKKAEALFVECEVLGEVGSYAKGKKTTIRASRLRPGSTGYRLIENPPAV